jgi:hypothetical protein
LPVADASSNSKKNTALQPINVHACKKVVSLLATFTRQLLY